MASDLSQLIQEGLCNTLNGLLARDASLKETNKAHEKDLDTIEVLKVDSVFDFEHLSTTLKFIIPAYSASFIFNTMMGATDTEPALTIDDDTADAINEFVSTTSGSLTTAINGSGFEDLGSVKFNIAKNEVISGKDITDLDNTYKFSIDLEGTDIVIFILFEETLIPYIEALTKYPVTVYEEEPEEEEVVEEEPVEEEPVKEEPKEEEPPKEEPVVKEEPKEEEPVVEKKGFSLNLDGEDKKLKLAIIGIAGVIVLLLLSGLVMYFMGVFDEPEPVVVKKDLNTTKKVPKDQVKVIKYTTLKKVDFKISDIDVNRLNGRLAVLTKSNVLNQEELKSQKLKEKERLKNLDKEKEFIEFAKANKEEPLVDKVLKKEEQNDLIKTTNIQNNPDIKAETTIEETKQLQQEVVEMPKEKETETLPQEEVKKEIVEETTEVEANEPEEVQKEEKLKFVLANSLKYKFFKDILTKTTSKEASISICSDQDGRTVMYIGPFENEDMQKNMHSLIVQEDSNIQSNTSEITTEEFNTRCNF
jgi:hypothetical protein